MSAKKAVKKVVKRAKPVVRAVAKLSDFPFPAVRSTPIPAAVVRAEGLREAINSLEQLVSDMQLGPGATQFQGIIEKLRTFV